MIQVIRTRSECRSCSMFGRARITMVESRAAIKEPTVVTESATHLYAGFFMRNTPDLRKEKRFVYYHNTALLDRELCKSTVHSTNPYCIFPDLLRFSL